MQRDDARRLAEAIQRQYPHLRCTPLQYGPGWLVEVINPRTNEQIQVVDATTWQNQLLTMPGAH
jgi:hypothetical protein